MKFPKLPLCPRQGHRNEVQRRARETGGIDGPIRLVKHGTNHRIERGLAKHAGCGPYLMTGNNRIFFFFIISLQPTASGGR